MPRKDVINSKKVTNFPLLSHAIKAGGTIYCSGQVARNISGDIVGIGDVIMQANQAFENLEAVLEGAEASLDDVVKVTIYLTNMDHKTKVAEARKSYFKEPPPATTLVSVNSLADPNLLIEIDAIAVSR